MDNFTQQLFNATGPEEQHWLKKYYDKSILSILIIIMFSMGCTIRFGELWTHLRRPWSVIAGLVSQFILLPACSFGLMVAFKLDGYFALGMLILSCSPSGTTSNIFTYYLDGDVPLSISMTVCSTVVAMGMMPFNMWFYGQTLESKDMQIPYLKMIRSLAYITAPAALGMVVLYKLPKVAPYITKLGSMAGFAMIGVSQCMVFVIYPNIFAEVPLRLVAAVVILPIVGMAVGYIFAVITKRPNAARRTISIESGVQNVGTAITVVTLTIVDRYQQQALVFPLMYSYCMLALCFIGCITYNLYMKFCTRRYEVEDEKKVPPQIAIDASSPTAIPNGVHQISVQPR